MMRASRLARGGLALALAGALWAVLGLGTAAAAIPTPTWSIATGSEPTAPKVPHTVANEVYEVNVTGTKGLWELINVVSPEFAFQGSSSGERERREYIGPIAVEATAAEVQATVEAAVGKGNVLVTGGQPEGKPYRIEFTGELAATPINITEAYPVAGAEAVMTQATEGTGVTGRLTATAVSVGETTLGLVKVTAPVPAGFVATRARGEEMLSRPAFEKHGAVINSSAVFGQATCEIAVQVATCTLVSPLAAGDGLEMTIYGYPEPGTKKLAETAAVSADGVEAKATNSPQVGGSVPFGIEPGSLMFAVSGAGAGGHPNLTTGFALSQSAYGKPAGLPRAIDMKLPAGLIGDPQATRTCSMTEVDNAECPASKAVGVAIMRVAGRAGGGDVVPLTALVYNVQPASGEPAAFAFDAAFPVRLDTHVGPHGKYTVEVKVEDVTELEQLVSTYITLWGVPAEHSGTAPETIELEAEGKLHSEAVDGPYMDGASQGYGVSRLGRHTAFMDYPTQCLEELKGSLGVVAWQEYNSGGQLVSAAPAAEKLTLPTPTECDLRQFSPQIEVQPTTDRAGQPAGYTVHLKVPQSEAGSGSATPEVRNVELAMPQGTVISPSAAKGLGACSEAQLAPNEDGKGNCPSSSDIGKVKITTPLLALPLEGNVYVGQPECSPCSAKQAAEGKMVKLYLEAEGSGVRIKLMGSTRIDSTTGRLTTVFANNPQLPFSDLALSLKNGPDAPLVNPSTCGNVVASANITAWTAMFNEAGGLTDPGALAKVNAPAIPISGCKAAGFAPSMAAGMTGSAQAGAFSAFSVTLSRPDGDRALGKLAVNMPAGISAILGGVPLCPEGQANAGTCSTASLIGTTTTVVGPGSEPYTIHGGKVYLTEKYGGGSFGLSIVTPATAGPFTLAGQDGQGRQANSGTVVIRAGIYVNPQTGAITVVTGQLPSVLDGIPLSIDRVIVNVNRADFMFNPTNCDAMAVTGTVLSANGGAVAGVSTPFQAHGCAALPFKPRFSALIHAKHSRKDGEYLHVAITSAFGQANIQEVHVKLPGKLPSRLSTLKLACTEAQFAANPAGCPPGSFVGTAVAHTPVLPVPLAGPAVFVSHAGRGFPNLDLVLQGDGVHITLVGDTYINKRSITTSTFKTVPDVPVTRFDLVLPAGSNSALAGNGNMCAHALHMPTTITGQNGKVLKHDTKVQVTGCRPELHVVKTRRRGAKAKIVVQVPSAGKLVANGRGIERDVKKTRKAKRVTLTVSLRRQVRRMLRHHHHRRLKVTVRLRFHPRHGRRITDHVNVLMR